MRDQLLDLINRMCFAESVANSAESVSWRAHREAEALCDPALVIELQDFLAEKITKEQRRAAYFIIGKIGRNTPAAKFANVLIGYIVKEGDKYALAALLDVLADMPMEKEADLSPIFRLLADSRWLVRHAAIRALKNASSPQTESEILGLLQRTDDAHDLVYGHSTLGRIGTGLAIPLLERGLRSRKPDVKSSAAEAIAAIRQRATAQPVG